LFYFDKNLVRVRLSLMMPKAPANSSFVAVLKQNFWPGFSGQY
jgi:hypothetical protein